MRNRNWNLPVLRLRGRTTAEDMTEMLRKAEKALLTFTPKQPADDPPQPVAGHDKQEA
jgi:hypothetical protein